MDGLAILFLLVALYCVVSALLGQRSITMPIVFVAIGLLLGARGLGVLALAPEAEVVKGVTEVTLALLLFADASTLKVGRVGVAAPLAARLLTTGLLLSIALGGIVAYLVFPAAGIGVTLLIGAVLAPTDAALGLPIFTNPLVPARIRQALNVESGLNDGIATPFVSLFIALAVAPNAGHDGGWLLGALEEIGIACLVGIGIGLVGGTLLTAASQRGWTSEASEELATLAFALAAFFGAASLGGNGFIAAFSGGIAFGALTRGLPDAIAAYTQTTGTFLSIWVWTVFGAAFVPLALTDHFDWRAILYALLSLTVIRMVPVAIALRGERLRRDTVLLMGWFGPRGLASIVFLLTAFLALERAHKPVDTLVAAATWTIFLSVLVHGVSAGPLAGWYARRLQTAGPELAEVQETADVTALRRHL